MKDESIENRQMGIPPAPLVGLAAAPATKIVETSIQFPTKYPDEVLGGSRTITPAELNSRRRIWIDGQESFVREDEANLSDAEIRTKRNAEFLALKQRISRDEKRIAHLRAEGLFPSQIKALRYWEEHGTGDGPITPQFTRHVFESSKREPCTKKEAEFLFERMARIEQLKADAGTKYGVNQVPRLVTESKALSSAAALRGDPNPPKILSYDEGYELLRNARREIDSEIYKLFLECKPLLERVRADLMKIADKMADDIQGEELEQHEKHDGKFGFPYVPSRTLITLRQMSWRVPEELGGGLSRELLKKLAIKI